jgi:hypothetical protein
LFGGGSNQRSHFLAMACVLNYTQTMFLYFLFVVLST